MSYGRYFPISQKVFLKRIFPDEQRLALDSITGYVTRCGVHHLDISLPYGSDAVEDYPFDPGMPFEVLCDIKGMGLRLQSSFLERTSSRDIRLQFEGNLEFISRRQYPRVDVTAWVGIERSAGSLSEMKRSWEERVRMLETGTPASQLAEFHKLHLNLAGGGIRFPMAPPVKVADLLLVYISIGDKEGIICAMSEVVWTGKLDSNGDLPTGLRYLNILENDQARIDKVVKALLAKL